MGRPFNQGLKYFQVDTNISDNKKLEKMEARHGCDGFSFVIKMWARIFSDSYYLELDEDIVSSICRKVLNKSIDEFNMLLKSSLEFGIFDSKLYSDYHILTSKAMQNRYLEISKRWKKVLFIKDYMAREVNIAPYHLFICNKLGHIIEEKYPEVLPGSKKTEDEQGPKKGETRKPATSKIQTTSHPRIPASPKIVSTELKGSLPTEEVHRICALNWDTQNELFKQQIEQSWFDSYKEFNKIIDSQYPQIRNSNFQLSPVEYKNLSTSKIDDKKPSKAEILSAIRKLAGNGVQPNFSVFFKLQDYIRYVRQDGNSHQGNPDIMSTPRPPQTIDHTEALKNF
jgi:hypothetical protein